MMDALYHFDHDYHVKAILREGVEELVHKEVAGTLNATFPGESEPLPGDMLGFLCIDGRFRLFVIDDVDYEDASGQVVCTAIDAAMQELTETVIPGEVQPLDATVTDALNMWLSGTAWRIGKNTTTGEKSYMRSYYQSLWEILTNAMGTWSVRIIPYYTFTNGKITGRYIDVEPDVGVYRGRLVESGHDAEKVSINRTEVPVTALYGLGAQLETEDGSENAPHLTFADVVWSKANGNPADKPAGQDWIGDPDALEKYGRGGAHRFAVAAFDEIEDATVLLTATWEHLQTINEPKRSAKGNLYDIEMIDGAKHAAICTGDIIRLRPARYPEDIEARITEIQRNYIDASRTTFEIGDKEASARADIQALTINARHTEKTLIIDRRKINKTEDRVELHAQTIDLQGEFILANATAIAANAEVIALHSERVLELTAGQEDLMSEVTLLQDEIKLRVTNDDFETALSLKADSASLTTLSQNVEAQFDEQGRLIAGYGTQIQTNADAIALRAVKADVDAQFTVTAGEISSKVSKDGVISAINQTPESVTIAASKVNLEGYVTADALEVKGYITAEGLTAALASAAYVYADRLVSKRAELDVLYAENMFFSNQALGLYPDIQVCTRARAYSHNTTTIRYTDWYDGAQKSVQVLTSAEVSVEPTYRTISYLGYK